VLDLLLPATDGGVAVQFVVVTAIAGGLVWIVRRDRNLRLLVIGLSVLTYGLMALRAVH